MSKWDIEAKTMNSAILYFEQIERRDRERFIYHLVHRYFPTGQFQPDIRERIDFSLLEDKGGIAQCTKIL